jgi:predicted nucleic acid-binding protein
MAMKRGNTFLIDTNVLLGATDVSRSNHTDCIELLARFGSAGVHLVTIGQVLREYLVVATRPVEVNGLGLSGDDAVRNVRSFRTRIHLLPETIEVHDELVAMVGRYGMKGKRIHDANIAAAARYHRINGIVTANTGDYGEVSEVPLLTPNEATHVLDSLIAGRGTSD